MENTSWNFNDVKEKFPVIIDCDHEAKAYYIKWHDQLALEAWLGTEEDEDSMLAKLRGQCLRIALQLHAMDAVLDGKQIDDPVSLDVMQRACEFSDWLKAHQRAAWRMLKGAASMPTGRELRVCEAIVTLESEIVNGFLPTARIVETVNGSIEERYRMISDSVGKTCSKLGLENSRTEKQKGWVVAPEDIARFRELLEQPGIGGRRGRSEDHPAPYICQNSPAYPADVAGPAGEPTQTDPNSPAEAALVADVEVF
ncbi:Protein of unknown function [Desulfonatronum zhilinae]|nr:Protein of unknown function [Desulfonatronum zhilinae]